MKIIFTHHIHVLSLSLAYVIYSLLNKNGQKKCQNIHLKTSLLRGTLISRESRMGLEGRARAKGLEEDLLSYILYINLSEHNMYA